MNASRYDVVIAGGGVGGVAAALRLTHYGYRVALTEETDWIGGQLTSQAVPPDEHGWIESFGCTATYRQFRIRVRQYYFDHYPVKAEVRRRRHFNPGNGWVSPLCHEPGVAHQVLQNLLQPAVEKGLLSIYLRTVVREVGPSGATRTERVCIQNLDTSKCETIFFSFLLDATENGDLLPLANVDFRTGRESQEETGEPGAAEIAQPENVQAISACFVVEHHEGENHLISEPENYAYWRNYEPRLTPPWPGKLLSWETPHPRTMETQKLHFHPHRETMGFFSGLWTFRRILDREQFEPGAFSSDRCLVNWPMVDYLEGNLLTVSDSERQHHIKQAGELSRSLLFWMQTEAPRPDGGTGWPGLKLCPEVTNSPDGLAKAVYIRESRRIKALKTIREQEVSATYRPGTTLAEPYEDSVGIGYYRIDLHPSTGSDNYIDVPSLPFRIPLGALIPETSENVLPAAKNIGTTHITNGCYRLHPVEWNIGESAAALVHACLEQSITPQTLYADPDKIRKLQSHLEDTGVELAWPEDINLEEGDPHAHAMGK